MGIGDIKGPRGARSGETHIGPRPKAPEGQGRRPSTAGTAFQKDGMEPQGTRIVRSPFAAPSEGTRIGRNPLADGPRQTSTEVPRTPVPETPRNESTQTRVPVPETPRNEGTQPRVPVPETPRNEGTQPRVPVPETGREPPLPQQARAPLQDVPRTETDGPPPPPPDVSDEDSALDAPLPLPDLDVAAEDGTRRTRSQPPEVAQADVPAEDPEALAEEPGEEELPLPPRTDGSRVTRRPIADALRDPSKMSGNGTEPRAVLRSGAQPQEAERLPESPPKTVAEAFRMSSLRILPRLIRLLGAEGLKRPEGGQPPEAGPIRRPPPGAEDAFRTRQPIPAGRPPIAGEERAPLMSVEELLPPGLEGLAGQEELGLRFTSDAALLAMHLKPSHLGGSERAQRLWAFYAAYAAAATALPPQPEAREAFREGLQSQGFAELRDANTGKDGVERGLWVLASRNPDEARERAATVRLEPPPEVRVSESVARQDAPLSLQPGMQAPRGMAVPVPMDPREVKEDEAQYRKRVRDTWKRLSPRMLWNVLHSFRDGAEDGAVAEGQWDRLAFAAILALTAIALGVVALVSL